MKFYKLTLFILFSLLVTNVVAQLNTLKNYTLNDGLPSLKINDITQDNTGYLWFASNKGLIRFDGNDFTNFTTKDNLISNKTQTISKKNNTLLIGTNKGLSIKNYNKFINFEGQKINCILKTPEHIFLGTNEGILRVREDFLSPIRTNFQIDLNRINDFKFDGTFFWIATNKGLWKLDKIINPTLLKRIDLGNYTSIIIDNKNIIVSTYKNGLKIVKNDKIESLSNSPKKINDIVKINNELWVVSKDEGIEILDENYSFIKRINKYNTLKTNQINTVFQDIQKNIWIATNNDGIYKFTSNNSLPIKPKIAFQNIEVVYQPIDSIDINNYTKTLQLKPNQNHISFTYKTANINAPKKVKYRYKLNDKFSPWTFNSSINLANLNSGDYNFSIQSKVNGLESDPVKFHFYIDKPLYQKSWFQQLSAAIILIVLTSIVINYIRKIKRKNKAKVEKLELKNHLLSLEQKALQLQMNPHFIFNVLNGIKALGNSGKSTELNVTISKFATLLRGVLHNSRQEEVNLKEEIAILKNYIELEQQMSTNSFEYEINTNFEFDSEEILIPPMLIQPFIENSIKHGIKSIVNGLITINFSTQKDFLLCAIIDNGIGINQSKKSKKNTNHNSIAIKVTEERIKALSKKSKFSIEEIVENNLVRGTKVFFKIPLKTDF
ncbi:histidine kinase [uncultured Tenacibaculum sp.]|uniref:sensor histidine kinase n=1 Tax=uncultured Tenacibaculum sp. TaxID=174713 RepID=UPI00262E3ABE|nr:histidine kinase [uncultured Tenacibaculum sp.]